MRAPVCAVAALVAVVWAGGLRAQEPTPAPLAPGFEEEVNVTAVRVLIRARAADGSFLADLKPEEIQVLEDGVPAEVLGLEPLAGAARGQAAAPGAGEAAPATGMEAAPPQSQAVATRVALYLVPDLSWGGDLLRLLNGARAEAERLLALGPVTVVLASPEPRVLAESLTSVAEIDRALARKLPLDRPSEWKGLGKIRHDFAEDVGTMGSNIRAKLLRARVAVLEERALLEGALGRVVSWGRSQPKGAGFLVLGMDGFDWRLSEYYMRVLEPEWQGPGNPGLSRDDATGDYQEAQKELRQYDMDRDVEAAGAALAERGWSVVTFFNGTAPTGFPAGASQSAYDDSGDNLHSGTAPGDFDASVPGSRVLFPAEPLRAMAEITGGMFVRGAHGAWPESALGGVLDELGHSWVLTYQVARPADGMPHPLEVRVNRAGVTVIAPRGVFSGTPEGEAVLRAQQVLAGKTLPGALPVSLTLAPEAAPAKGVSLARMQVRADLARVHEALASLGKARFRVTVAVAIKGRDPFVTNDLQQAPVGEGDEWSYEAPLQWQKGATRLAVEVEELATGVWGIAEADLPRPK
jgi:hypothetical protein